MLVSLIKVNEAAMNDLWISIYLINLDFAKWTRTINTVVDFRRISAFWAVCLSVCHSGSRVIVPDIFVHAFSANYHYPSQNGDCFQQVPVSQSVSQSVSQVSLPISSSDHWWWMDGISVSWNLGSKGNQTLLLLLYLTQLFFQTNHGSSR